MRAISLLVVGLLIAGCVSVSPAAQAIRVVRTEIAVKDCRALGTVESRSGWGGFAEGGGFENNERSMRNRVAALGGDTLLIHTERGSTMPHSMGEAYRCAQ